MIKCSHVLQDWPLIISNYQNYQLLKIYTCCKSTFHLQINRSRRSKASAHKWRESFQQQNQHTETVILEMTFIAPRKIWFIFVACVAAVFLCVLKLWAAKPRGEPLEFQQAVSHIFSSHSPRGSTPLVFATPSTQSRQLRRLLSSWLILSWFSFQVELVLEQLDGLKEGYRNNSIRADGPVIPDFGFL